MAVIEINTSASDRLAAYMVSTVQVGRNFQDAMNHIVAALANTTDAELAALIGTTEPEATAVRALFASVNVDNTAFNNLISQLI